MRFFYASIFSLEKPLFLSIVNAWLLVADDFSCFLLVGSVGGKIFGWMHRKPREGKGYIAMAARSKGTVRCCVLGIIINRCLSFLLPSNNQDSLSRQEDEKQ